MKKVLGLENNTLLGCHFFIICIQEPPGVPCWELNSSKFLEIIVVLSLTSTIVFDRLNFSTDLLNLFIKIIRTVPSAPIVMETTFYFRVS